MKRDLPKRTWRYPKTPLLRALPHGPQKPGGRVEREEVRSLMDPHLTIRQTTGRHH